MQETIINFIKKLAVKNNKSFLETVRILDAISWSDFEKLAKVKISKKEFYFFQNIINDILLEEEWKILISDKRSKLFESNYKFDKSNPKLLYNNMGKIRTALRSRNYCAVYYQHANGEKGFRLIEPYFLGQGYKSKDKISQEHFKDYYLRSFVIKDTVADSSVKFNKPKSVSVSENLPYWRLLRVDRILNLVIIRRRFSFYREGFNGYGDSNIVKKLASVEFNEFKGMNTF